MSTRVGVGLRRQRLVERREPTTQPTLGHEGPSSARVRRTAQCNHDLPHRISRRSHQARSRAQRMGAMLVGMGVLHFVAPKPFDTIVPAELPGSARFYTLRLRRRRGRDGRVCCWPRAPAASARWPRSRCSSAVFPANVNMVRVWWDKGWPARIGDDRPAAAADPDDHPGAQDLPQRAALGGRQQRRPARRRRAAVGRDGAPAAHVVERRAHRLGGHAAQSPPTPAGRRRAERRCAATPPRSPADRRSSSPPP